MRRHDLGDSGRGRRDDMCTLVSAFLPDSGVALHLLRSSLPRPTARRRQHSFQGADELASRRRTSRSSKAMHVDRTDGYLIGAGSISAGDCMDGDTYSAAGDHRPVWSWSSSPASASTSPGDPHPTRPRSTPPSTDNPTVPTHPSPSRHATPHHNETRPPTRRPPFRWGPQTCTWKVLGLLTRMVLASLTADCLYWWCGVASCSPRRG